MCLKKKNKIFKSTEHSFFLCIGIDACLVKTQTSLDVTHTHQVPETGSHAPSPPPRGWQRAAEGSGAAGWAPSPSVPPASGLRGPPALGPPPPPAGSSPGSPASSAWAGSARWDSGSLHLQRVTRNSSYNQFAITHSLVFWREGLMTLKSNKIQHDCSEVVFKITKYLSDFRPM